MALHAEHDVSDIMTEEYATAMSALFTEFDKRFEKLTMKSRAPSKRC
jgi:hypothetical protein